MKISTASMSATGFALAVFVVYFLFASGAFALILKAAGCFRRLFRRDTEEDL